MFSNGRLLAYAAGLGALVLLTAALNAAEAHLSQTSIALCFVLLVVIAAVFLGRSLALVVAILAGLSFNYFFLDPRHTFRISSAQDVIAFLVLVATAIIVGQLSARAERRAIQAETRKQQLETAQKQVTETAAQADALRKSEQLKTALLDAVTHDLRTPLTSIKAAVTTLRSARVESEGLGELLQVIEEEADRLNGFIQSMIDLAQLEAGQLTLDRSEVSAAEIIEDALARAEPLLRDHPVEVSSGQDLPNLRADPRLVSQVLFTLLENAAKYSPPASPIEVRACSANGNGVRFSVTDRGPGVAPEMRERVFQKFVTGSASGLGLGLAIARGIVESHGGRIWIGSAPSGAGASAEFEIPSTQS